jgi:hypothetical protein
MAWRFLKKLNTCWVWWYTPVIQHSGGWGRRCEFEASPGCIVRPSLKNKPTNLDLPRDPTALLLDTYPKELKAGTQKLGDQCSQHYWQQPISLDRWVGKESVVYTCNWVLLSLEKEWSPDPCCNTDGPWGLSEITQTQKDKYHIIPL